MRGDPMTHRKRIPGFYVALIAILFRALLPSGWMPNLGGSGTPIILCSLDGPIQLVLGSDGQPVKQSPDQNDTHQNDVCPFAAAPHFATPVAWALLPEPVAVDAPPIVSAPQRLEPTSDLYTPQSPRGPPGIA